MNMKNDQNASMRQMLINLLCEIQCNGPEDKGSCPERRHGRCRSIERLEMCQIQVIADNLLVNGVIVPPVKVGQTVYYIRGGYYRKVNLEVCPITVTEINKKEVKGKLQWAFIANGTRYVFGSIGKTVFLTREDAEKALEIGEHKR